MNSNRISLQPFAPLRGRWLVVAIGLIVLTGGLHRIAEADDLPDVGDLPALPLVLDADSRWTTMEPFPLLRFVEPVYLCQAPNDADWFYVLEREGAIHRFRNDADVLESELFLDMTGMVTAGRGQDNGLLGMAFHPQFGQVDSPNGRYFFIYYTTRIAGTTYYRLSRFEIQSGDGDDQPDAIQADRASETILVQQHNRDHLHNGGSLQFGPDGFLYWSVGDEGGQGDPFRSGQRIDENLFSGVFRIDVDRRGGEVSRPPRYQPQRGQTANYYIPLDNPFIAERSVIEGALEEYWALGFRSPHRMSFDPDKGDLWLGDVGHASWESIAIVTAGSNFGWSYREGFVNYQRSYLQGRMPDPYPGEQAWPIYAYAHGKGDGCVIGGHVYRGQAMPSLVGWYIFGDLNSGRIWALRREGERAAELRLIIQLDQDSRGRRGLSSFGIDHQNEIYLCLLGRAGEPDGRILRLIERTSNEE